MSHRYSAEGRQLRRRLWLQILLPFAFVLLLMLAGVAAALLLPSPTQVALVADTMLTLLALCPLTLVVFALLIVSLALVLQMRRWGKAARSPLRRLEAATARAHQRVDDWLCAVDSRVLEWAVRLAPLRSLLTMFDAPPQESDEADS